MSPRPRAFPSCACRTAFGRYKAAIALPSPHSLLDRVSSHLSKRALTCLVVCLGVFDAAAIGAKETEQTVIATADAIHAWARFMFTLDSLI